MSSTSAFPSPVGGVALSGDLGTSILFAILYAPLLPIFLVRFANRQSRAVLSLNSVLTVVERIVVFSLRAWQSRTPAEQASAGLATYMQVTISMAYILIAQDTVSLLRCLYINSTQGSSWEPADSNESFVGTNSSQIPLSPSRGNWSSPYGNGEVRFDQPRQRAQYRRWTDVLRLVFLAATVPGIIGNLHYKGGMTSASTANEVMTTRYVSSGIALALITFVSALVFRARRLQKVRPIQLIILLTILACNASSAIFRLAFMYHRTTSLTSTAAGSGNTPAEKATFYVFHMLSDWLACCMFLVPDLKNIFNTGMWGDWRSADPPESSEFSKKQREAKLRRVGLA